MKKEELVIDVNDLSLNSLLDEFVQTQSPLNTSGTTTFSEVVEEELEWLNKDAFPEVDFGIFSMSPVSVLNDGCRNKAESNGNGRTFTNSSESFKVARRTRTGKRRACCDKWLIQPDFPPWDQVRAIKESSVVLSSLPTKRANGGAALVMGRKCSHCQTDKTPQWRLGPMGPKTLCNACGVRFKSGRLFPEYRPACSPTFSSALHSNSHRKVIEMRRQKQISTGE